MDTTELIAKAMAASENAYAPYSQYCVGAALLTQKGACFVGTNVENSSYGATVCAERTAVFSAVAQEGPTMRLAALALVTSSSPPAAPCGLCLQVLAEFAEDDLPVTMANRKGEQVTASLGALLPQAFRPHMLHNRQQ